jgi:two-component system response regulator MtrA
MRHKNSVLLVDDDPMIHQQVKPYLERNGFDVTVANDGHSALKAFERNNPDLVVLDIQLPKTGQNSFHLDGIEVLRRLRETRKDARILMLSATNISAVKVMTLSIGADDYLPKPFNVEELTARINAILRRGSDLSEAEVLRFKRITLDANQHRVWKDGNPIELTRLEFNLLYTLARRPQNVLTREKLLETVIGPLYASGPKTIDVHIGHIRKKICDDPDNPTIITTVRGTGYRFEDEPLTPTNVEDFVPKTTAMSV